MSKWEMVRLGDIVEKPLSGEWGNEDKSGTGVPVLRTTNFTDEGIINYTNVVFREISPKKFEKKALKYGDIIIEKSGGSDTKPVGRVVYYDGNSRQYIYNNFTASLRVNTDTVDPRYLFLFLFCYYKSGITARYENKTTGIHNLRLNDFLEQVKIPLPPLDEQKRIARNLDLASEIVKGYKELLAELDKLVKSIFYEMFGDPVTNEKGWNVKYIDELYEIIDGDRGTNYPKQEDFSNEGYCLFLNAGNVTKKGFIFENVQFIKKRKDDLLRKGKLQRDDIVLTTRGTVGNLAHYTENIPFENMRINSGMVILRRFAEIEHNYFLKYFCNPLIYTSLMSGSAQPQLPIASMRKAKVLFPPLSLQTRFAAIVTEIEAQKLQVQQALIEAENLFNSLMQEYFE